MSRWRVGWRWYLIAPGIILAAHLGALVFSLWLGGLQIVSAAHLLSPSFYLGAIVPVLFLGGQWEEPGWMGYLQWRLQSRFPLSALLAALTGSLFRMVWHIPLFLSGAIPWYDLVFISIAWQIIFAWLYNRTNGSVLIPMLCHLSSNLVFAMISPLLTGPDRESYWVVYVAVVALMVSALLLTTRGRLGVKTEPSQSIAAEPGAL